MRTERCGCGTTMLWAVSIHRNPQPFDAEPADGGDHVLISRGGRDPLALNVKHLTTDGLGAVADTAASRHYAHHATCPDAEKYRRPTPPKESAE